LNSGWIFILKFRFDPLPTKEVVEAVHKLNDRPRKCLGFKTPYEVFEENTEVKMKYIFEIALIT